MRNKSSTAAIIKVDPTPVKAVPEVSPGPNWAVIAALVISILSLLKSLHTDWRGRREKRAARFEAEIGGAVRISLREFEECIAPLKAFLLPAGKPIKALKAEMENLRHDWIAGAESVVRLLGEIDSSHKLLQPDWRNAFRGRADQAEVTLQSISAPTLTTEADVMARSKRGWDDYEAAIAEVRIRLKSQVDSYDKWCARQKG